MPPEDELEPLIVGAEQLRLFINKQIKPAKVSKPAVYRLIKKGMPHGKFGKNVIGDPVAIRAYLVKLAGGEE